MKNINRILTVTAAVFLMTFFTGCDITSPIQENPATINEATTTETEIEIETEVETETEDTTTSVVEDDGAALVKLSLTDAPVDDENIKGVYITFTGLKYEYINKDLGWEEAVFEKPVTLNLLDLRDGKVTSFGELKLKQGEVEHIRFMLDTDNCYITFNDDPERKEPLQIPSGAQTGFKSTNGFVVSTSGEIDITADFDVRKSLTVTGKGVYKMKPTIRLVNNMLAGVVAGNLDIGTEYSKVIVYLYEKGVYEQSESGIKSDFSKAYASVAVGTEGEYRLLWIAEGDYDLVVVGYDNVGEIENVIGYVPDIKVDGAYSVTEIALTPESLKDSL